MGKADEFASKLASVMASSNISEHRNGECSLVPKFSVNIEAAVDADIVTQTHLFIFLALVADGLAGLSGGLLPERWLVRHQGASVGFAAGALLGAVFLDILPEAIHEFGLQALRWTLFGFMILTIVYWFVGHEHHIDENARVLPSTLLSSDVLH